MCVKFTEEVGEEVVDSDEASSSKSSGCRAKRGGVLRGEDNVGKGEDDTMSW